MRVYAPRRTHCAIEAQVPSNRIYKAYPVVGRYADGFHAVDLMADLMGRNESSFLYDKLVQNTRVFDSISASKIDFLLNRFLL